MSVGDCFLKLDQVPGEADDAAHLNEIEVSEWNWSMQTPYSEGVPSGRTDVRMFEFCHLVDSASAGLMDRCTKNTNIPKAVLTMRRAGGDAQTYLTITFSQVRVASVTLQHDVNHLIPQERVRLAFYKVEYSYTPQNAKGASATGMKTFSYEMTKP